MKHIPYGYRIENGMAVVDKAQADTVRNFFDYYISGLALMAAAEKAGLQLYHGGAGRMLRNVKYLGDDYYPAIIDKATIETEHFGGECRAERSAKAACRDARISGQPANRGLGV